MQNNQLTTPINKSVSEAFNFCITPPNSTTWIPGIVKEETNQRPVQVGTIYSLTNTKGEVSKVTVTAIKESQYVEWISADFNYHCRYTFKAINAKSCVLEYFEWVDKGEITEPFTQSILKKLKSVIE